VAHIALLAGKNRLHTWQTLVDALDDFFWRQAQEFVKISVLVPSCYQSFNGQSFGFVTHSG